ncbi:Bestrophin, RFP-TM, chloride channel-domain-containing protein [Lenzites betulinus]|nr:Bestrophin, RFP-TM, chloride channel-domain-containing protein [Lenzites betulinus]
MSQNTPQPRSSTGHVLLPAFNSNDDPVLVPLVTSRSLVSWTFGRGTVIWRIWPAVLLHTVFAAIVVSVSLTTRFHLGIPNVMLTLLGTSHLTMLTGVVIGFVISYRASSGYDRYYQGRSAWSDLARTSRTFSRLIWIHVPLKLVPIPANTDGTNFELDTTVARRIMAEKRTALAMIEGFVVGVKHHLRGEMGIYYEDLYPLVKPLHDHPHHQRNKHGQAQTDVTVSSPRDLHPEDPPRPLLPHLGSSSSQPHADSARPASAHNLIIPPINAYGTFTPPSLHIPPTFSPALSRASSVSLSDTSSEHGADRPLLPGAVPAGAGRHGLFGSVSADLVPFSAVWRTVGYALGWRGRRGRTGASSMAAQDIEDQATAGGVDADEGGIQRIWNGDDENGNPAGDRENGRLQGALAGASVRLGLSHSKHRPRLAGGGENLPLEILRSLSIWVSVLDERGVVPGPVLGAMYGCCAAFEDSLCTLERILTTPLPFVYSVHIRTVWIYLFFLPFQLVDLFGWYAIPGVGIAAFIYLGLIAAGEEIEQPFGYDENDLDLDFFCRAIIHADIERLKRVVCPNVFLGAHHIHAGVQSAHAFATDPRTKVEAVFGEFILFFVEVSGSSEDRDITGSGRHSTS